jgi:citrate synthase
MQPNQIGTRIWQEDAEPDNHFVARVARCHGYDVYGDMLGKASWAEMLYLLFRGEAPPPAAARLLDGLAVALANPGPRDPSVHAAMCGGATGTPAAAILMAALAVGAGQNSGGHEVLAAMRAWLSCATDVDAWRLQLTEKTTTAASAWPAPEHPPGFDPHGVTTSLIVRQTLDQLAAIGHGSRLAWLVVHRADLEKLAGQPLAMTGVAAAAFADLGFPPEQGEALFLILRLPGAAAHALEQASLGHKKFPFYEIEFETMPTGASEELSP